MLVVGFVLVLCGGLAHAEPHTTSARVWLSHGTDYGWPESDLAVVKGRANNGACFTGGGNRAYTAAVGYFRALHQLGWFGKLRYTTAISGGSWALSALNFRPQTDTAAFLGSCTPPEQLSLEFLASAPERNTIGYAVPAGQSLSNLTELFFGADSPVRIGQLLAGPHAGSDRLWTKMVGELYLESIGVPSESPVAWDAAHVDDIIARNPHLDATSFVLPRPGLPFPVILGAVMGPLESVPLANNAEHNAFTGLDFTPLYAGEAFARDVTYQAKNGSQETVRVGGFVEPFAFGGKFLTPPPQVSTSTPHATTLSNMTSGAFQFGVRDATGISSMALSSASCTDSEAARQAGGLPVCDIVPRFAGVSLIDDRERTMVLGDGGVLENTGAIALLRRGVDDIVVFDATSRTVDDNDNMQGLFGINPGNHNVNDGFYYAHNHVFPNTTYATLVAMLRDKIDNGEPAVATLNVTTVENQHWGVPAGQRVRLTWVYLNAPTKWLERLPQETQAAINDQSATGMFLNFPRFETGAQFFLTPSQFNLLAELTCHIALESKDALHTALGLDDPDQDDGGDSDGLTSGQIVGIAVGCAVLVGLGALLAYGIRTRASRPTSASKRAKLTL